MTLKQQLFSVGLPNHIFHKKEKWIEYGKQKPLILWIFSKHQDFQTDMFS